jgi:cytochrome c oxidase subunit I+III
VAALLSYQGFHGAIVLVLAGYLCARAWQGLLTPQQRATFDNAALLWHGSCAQGIVVALLPHLVVARLG